MRTRTCAIGVVGGVWLLSACSSSNAAAPDAGTHTLPDAGTTRDARGAASDAGDASAPATDAAGRGGEAGEAGALSTASVGCTYTESTYNDSPSVEATSKATWTCTSTVRSLTANGLPDHATGTFPNTNCPNTISAQTVSATMPLTPENTGSATSVTVGGVGYAFNGVKFDPATAGTCGVSDGGATTCTLIGNDGEWDIEALGQSSFNFGVDDNNAHVQPTGAYHYHGIPTGILTKLNKGMTPTLVGFARDGFPIYARYGYTTPTDPTSAVKVMKASYRLKSTPPAGRPSTATYPLGAFTQDYEYVEGSGDLDACNGRTDVTPEFPQGIYHYYITDTYPFIQRCVMGTATAAGGTGTMMAPAGEAGSPCTASSCASGDVCCPEGQPCAGECVPNCNTEGTCPTGLTCDSSLGICKS